MYFTKHSNYSDHLTHIVTNGANDIICPKEFACWHLSFLGLNSASFSGPYHILSVSQDCHILAV